VGVLALLRYVTDPLLMRFRFSPALKPAIPVVVAVALVAIAATNPLERIRDFTDPPALTPAVQRGFVERHLESAEGSGRFQFWEAAGEAFRSDPLTGIGAGGFEAWWAREGSLPLTARDAHSLFLETLAELGIAGFLLIVSFVVVVGVTGFRRRVDAGTRLTVGVALAAFAAGLVSAAVDWTWELPAAFAPVVVLAAVLAGPPTAPRPNRTSPGRTRSRFGLGIATLLIGWAALIACAIALVTEVKLGDSRAATRKGDLERAATEAKAARAVQPWAAAPRLQLALVEELEGDLGAALRATGEALERSPEDWRLWLVEARLRTKSGDVRAARRALARARALNPRSPIFATDNSS
jgi:hypothetical protein